MDIERIELGGYLRLEDFMAVVRHHEKVALSEEFCARVEKSRAMVERCVAEERVVYGTTTGFGRLVSQTIDKSQAEQLQKNIILTHAVAVGEPFGEEEVRAILLMSLQSMGCGFSGVRLLVAERYVLFLNRNLIPYAPSHGSVGYLNVEGHIVAAMLGEGKIYYEGELLESAEAHRRAGIEPLSLSYKEGLALINGTISASALAAVAIHDLLGAAKAADVVAALSLEGLKGLVKAFDPRVAEARPQREIADTMDNIRRILADSQVVEAYKDSHVQDALSLRSIPQHHGAAKRVLRNALEVVEAEINSTGDNPILVEEDRDVLAISSGNPDAAYVGMQMDAAAIAATGLAKMSERRNVRFLDTNLSGYPWFLVHNPGLNSGLMIPQYTQAGLLNEMRILSTPATIDNVTTSANQEDYVSMGYNACRKAVLTARKLEYVLAIELFSAFQAQQFLDESLIRGRGSRAVYRRMAELVPVMKEDMYLYPHLETLRNWIHEGGLVKTAEEAVGELK